MMVLDFFHRPSTNASKACTIQGTIWINVTITKNLPTSATKKNKNPAFTPAHCQLTPNKQLLTHYGCGRANTFCAKSYGREADQTPCSKGDDLQILLLCYLEVARWVQHDFPCRRGECAHCALPARPENVDLNEGLRSGHD